MEESTERSKELTHTCSYLQLLRALLQYSIEKSNTLETDFLVNSASTA